MDELRIAFDGDAVLFSDEAEVIAKKDGLHAFFQNETEKEQIPLEKGPLIQFAFILGKMQKKFRQAGAYCPIRTYLVTARRYYYFVLKWFLQKLKLVLHHQVAAQ